MSYADIFTAANDAAFQGRCQVAVWIAAQDILNEDATTSDHQKRADWARQALQGRLIITPLQIAMQVLRNGVIAGSPSAAGDDAIQYQVNSILPSIIAIG